MLRVLLYDLRASALLLLPVVFVGSVGALSTARFGPAFFWWNAILAAALALLGPAVEWRTGCAAFLHSLPASRGHVVAGRFLGAGLAVLVISALAATLAPGLAALVEAMGRPWLAWVRIDVLLAFVVVAACVAGPALALVFVYGLGAGATLASLYTMTFAALVEVPAALWAGAAQPDVTARAGGGVVRLAAAAVAERYGAAAAAAAALAAACLVLWASGRVAWRAHGRREF